MDLGAILYPSLLVCGLFGLMMAVGLGFSYLWLVMIHKQLSRCPECQRRGGGEIVETKVLAVQNHMDFKRYPPARVTVKTLEDHYKCQYCGHVWTQTGQETTRTRVKP